MDIIMGTQNIYQKPCPACGSLVSTSAKNCDCGYSADLNCPGDVLADEEVAREEELFEAYITARVDQLLVTLESARADLAVDRINPKKSSNLIKVLQEVLKLRDERDAQAMKTAAAKKTAEAAKRKAKPTEIGRLDRRASYVPEASTEPTEAFRAQQSARAAKVMQTFNNTKIKPCPHCQTVLPVTSALCLCGYVFAYNDFLHPTHAGGAERTIRPGPK